MTFKGLPSHDSRAGEESARLHAVHPGECDAAACARGSAQSEGEHAVTNMATKRSVIDYP
jgi:hypothetical protein